MEAPEVIYVPLIENTNGEEWIYDVGLSEELDIAKDNIKYIRKDFLMKRLARAKELRERHSSNPNTLREYIAPIEALMDIINSL